MWVRGVLTVEWGSVNVVSLGRVHDASQLPGFLAERGSERVGLITHSLVGGDCEVVTLNSFLRGQGVGSALLEAVRAKASSGGCRRLWLITTNDNTTALRFFQRRGWDIVALHRNAIFERRRLKPEIPLRGLDGIPIRHAFELEFLM